MLAAALALALALALPLSCLGSAGDRDPHYVQCVQQCLRQESEVIACRTWCAVNITLVRQRHQLPPFQYNGRWAFYPLFGIQEPASSLFCLGNLAAHLWARWRGHVRGAHWRWFWFVSCVAWICAAVFHARDTHLTELLDYGTSALVLWSFSFATGVFVLPTKHTTTAMLFAATLAGYAAHVAAFLHPRIDYGPNMIACVGLSLFAMGLWVGWLVFGKPQHKGSGRDLHLFLLCTAALSLLEIFDFPPFFLALDAHALWHAGTIVTTVLLWRFLSVHSK
jgi:post-GPI attachment to proteins factor 3